MLAFLNIVGKGMGGGAIEQDLNDMDAQATAETWYQDREDDKPQVIRFLTHAVL